VNTLKFTYLSIKYFC